MACVESMFVFLDSNSLWDNAYVPCEVLEPFSQRHLFWMTVFAMEECVVVVAAAVRLCMLIGPSLHILLFQPRVLCSALHLQRRKS
jgi:hypothetical protein